MCREKICRRHCSNQCSSQVGCRDVMRICIMSIWLKVAPELRHLDIEAGSNHQIKSENAFARVRDSRHGG